MVTPCRPCSTSPQHPSSPPPARVSGSGALHPRRGLWRRGRRRSSTAPRRVLESEHRSRRASSASACGRGRGGLSPTAAATSGGRGGRLRRSRPRRPAGRVFPPAALRICDRLESDRMRAPCCSLVLGFIYNRKRDRAFESDSAQYTSCGVLRLGFVTRLVS